MKGKGAEDWEAEKLIALARSLQPRILIDNRTGIEQDVWTPEQYQLQDWLRHPETGERVVWEACQTFSGSWGYYRDETSWKSPGQLIRMLVNTVSAGGNLLMNVGPTARGCFDRRACEALTVFADWMKYNSRSIYGCTMAEPDLLAACPRDCRMTQSPTGSASISTCSPIPSAAWSSAVWPERSNTPNSWLTAASCASPRAGWTTSARARPAATTCSSSSFRSGSPKRPCL